MKNQKLGLLLLEIFGVVLLWNWVI